MKKTILIILVFMSVLLHAQDKKISFGAKVGANFVNATGNGVEFILDRETSSSSRLGLLIGGFMEYRLSSKFALQLESLYSQQGFQKKLPNEAEIELRQNYINIPVIAKYYATDGLSLEIGPQLGFLTSANYFIKSLANNQENTQDVREYFKNIDFGLNFGISYQLKNGLGISTRYVLGLTDIFDHTQIREEARKSTSSARTSIEPGEDIKLKNRVFTIGLTYTF